MEKTIQFALKGFKGKTIKE